MKFTLSYLAHLLIFATALVIGGLPTSQGVDSAWYASLQLPPWQPPSWAFGTAWTIIALTFSIGAARLVPLKLLVPNNNLAALFWLQFALNILWNYLFFHYQLTGVALVEIIFLGLVVASLTYLAFKQTWWAGLSMLPYLIWLFIAISLNAYIWRMN
jgi:benzodiazapine receptor